MEQSFGLTNEQASLRLFDQCTKLIQEYEREYSKLTKGLFFYVANIQGFLCLFVLVSLIINFVYSEISLTWLFRESLIVEFVIVGALWITNVLLVKWETDMDNKESLLQIKRTFEQLRHCYAQKLGDSLFTPEHKNACICRVLRGNQVEIIPWVFLVKDDILKISYGDVSPCKCELESGGLVLEQGQVFEPSLLPTDINRNSIKSFSFRALEFPVINTILHTLNGKRPSSLFRSQGRRLFQFLYSYFISPVLFLSFLFGLIRFALSYNRSRTWNSYLLLDVSHVIIPLLPFSFFLICILVHALGSTEIVLLYENLLQSSTPFDDEVGVDAFDEEALPPVKQVSYGSYVLIQRFINFLTRKPHQGKIYSHSLLETLSSTTVICSVDRDGTIAKPFSVLNQLLFMVDSDKQTSLMNENSPLSEPSNAASSGGNVNIPVSSSVPGIDWTLMLDLVDAPSSANGIAFEDNNWKDHINSLKPVGLDILLNHHCSITDGKRKNEAHGRLDAIALPWNQSTGLKTCQCALAREIGFQDDVLLDYEVMKRIGIGVIGSQTLTKRQDVLIPTLNVSILNNFSTGSKLLVCDGDGSLLIQACIEYWNGKELCIFDDYVKKKLIDFCFNAAINDLECIAFSYSPFREYKDFSELKQEYILYEKFPEQIVTVIEEKGDENKEQSNVSEEEELEKTLPQVLSEQIFLCLGTLSSEPKEDVCDFIEDLKLAGIRFVYFSCAGLRESKAFAERLGLETDWNSCILLSDENHTSSGYLETHDIKAKLPRGIIQIKEHIKNVDDIPLHVSLFADSTPNSIKEMIKVLQENGEVVCCLGSSLNFYNTLLFAEADVAIALEPLQMRHLNMKNSRLACGSSIISLPAALRFHSDMSLYSLSQLIRDARRFSSNAAQGFCFIIACYLSLSLIILTNTMLFLPPIFSGFHILWFQIIIVPILGIPFFLSPVEMPNVMKQMPVKNKDHLTDLNRFFMYFLLKFMPAVFLTCGIHIGCLTVQSKIPFWWWGIYNEQVGDWILSSDLLAQVSFSQSVCVFSLCLQFCIISFFFLHRTEGIVEYSPLKNRLYIPVSIFTLILQVLFLIPFFMSLNIYLSTISWIFMLIFIGPFFVAVIQEFTKILDRKHFTRFQKRSKLEFNTKLGCYSPV